MKITDIPLKGSKIVELKVFGDKRGFFVERFREDHFRENGISGPFVQDNHSRSAPGVLRGLHYQTQPAQGKLVGVVQGRIWDVCVDIRKNSPTYGQSYGLELSVENGRLLWVPAGFAHGFCVLGEEPADVYYKVDGYYNPATEGGIRWDDSDLKIQWPLAKPTISARDQELPSFAQYRANPVDW